MAESECGKYRYCSNDSLKLAVKAVLASGYSKY